MLILEELLDLCLLLCREFSLFSFCALNGTEHLSRNKSLSPVRTLASSSQSPLLFKQVFLDQDDQATNYNGGIHPKLQSAETN